MNVRRHPLDAPAYRALWAESPQRTVFAHPDVVRRFGEAFGVTTEAVLAVEGDGRWRAALPLFERRKGSFDALVAPLLAPVVSPLLAEPLAEAEVHARASPLDLLLEAIAASYDRATLLLHPTLTDVRPLTWADWDVRTRYTYTLDLHGGDPQAGWSSGTRRTAKKAAEAYRFEEDPDLAEAALSLMLASYERQGDALPIPTASLRTLVDGLIRDGWARTFGVRTEHGTVEAAVVVAHDGRTAHYWIAGSEPGPAMTVLLAHLLPALAEAGVATFDFMGANVPSIAEFKRRFGPALTPYAFAQQDFSRSVRVLRRFLGRG